MIIAFGLRRMLFVAIGVVVLGETTAYAVNIVIDYTYDSAAMGGSDFFGSGNPQGPQGGLQARTSIEAAADYFSLILNDSLAAIETPETITSTVFGTMAIFDWSMKFTSPGSGLPVELINPSVAADEYRVYVGGRALGNGTLAEGGPGGVERGRTVIPDDGPFSNSPANDEVAEVLSTSADFFSAVDDRGNLGQFGNWGGSITFDRDLTNWNLDHTRMPDANQFDLFSIALHEITHTLGFGGEGMRPDLVDFQDFVDDQHRFIGPATTAAYGDAVPLDDDLAHWAAGVNTTVFGTNDPQPSILDRVISPGERQLFGQVDAAALTDMGWEFVTPSFLDADFDSDTLVNGVDQWIWKEAFGLTPEGDADGNSVTDGADWLILGRQFGQRAVVAALASTVPEPSSALLAASTAVALWVGRRRRLGRRMDRSC